MRDIFCAWTWSIREIAFARSRCMISARISGGMDRLSKDRGMDATHRGSDDEPATIPLPMPTAQAQIISNKGMTVEDKERVKTQGRPHQQRQGHVAEEQRRIRLMGRREDYWRRSPAAGPQVDAMVGTGAPAQHRLTF